MKLTPCLKIAGGLLTCIMMTSCVTETPDGCPSLKVNITVTDKNYANIDRIPGEEAVSENLPIRDYVHTLGWSLRDAETGEVVKSAEARAIDNKSKTAELTFDSSLDKGTYILTVWGGLPEGAGPEPDTGCVTLHPDGTEGSDIYVSTGTIEYDGTPLDVSMGLERVKGKLIVVTENMPPLYTELSERVRDVYARVCPMLNYSGSTAVSARKEETKAGNAFEGTLLAPSSNAFGSTVSLRFLSDNDGQGVVSPNDTRVSIARNEITMLKYVWNAADLQFSTYVLVNGNWEATDTMNID